MPKGSSQLASTYILLVLIWATTPLAIVWSVKDLNLFWALAFRFFLALPIACSLLWIFKIRLPFDVKSIHSYVAGSFSFIGSQLFTYVATQYLSSGIIALMFGLAPIMAGLMGWLWFKQFLHFAQWCGMLIALSGLGLICFSGQQHIQPLGIILMLISVFNYALSIFWVKRVNAPLEPMAQATGSIMVSSLVVIGLLPFIWSDFPTHIPSLQSLLALAYTVVVASLLAMFCYFKLVQNIQPTTLSLTNVMTPLLALLIGALFNHEALSLQVVLGACVLIMGLLVYFFRDLQLQQKWQKRFKKM
ncbi:DMT family transporter [Acinetobacter sp. MB5]|uniref:DMT family transporter n=1 Tax=Acinetobacter sp. MB5 TaxID=2069438 RepID=UPI000DD0045A|nr:EamA family transporter [Acinetobacter sp. MB5]